MIDRFVLAVPLARKLWEKVARINGLAECTERGEVYYTSGKEARFDCIYLTIRGKGVRVSGSLHKFYYRATTGKADNSGIFTMEQAKEAFGILSEKLGVSFDRGVLTSYEIGLNLSVRDNPDEYIKKALSVSRALKPALFEDANYLDNKQKTTRKDKDRRKYYKIYNKTYQVKKSQGIEIPNTLRIETAYRRQRAELGRLLAKDGAEKIVRAFRRDWESIQFESSYEVRAGVRETQARIAIAILEMGKEAYLQSEESRKEEGTITEKQYRRIREFVRDYETKHQAKVRRVATKEEIEYRIMLRDSLSG